MINLRIANYRCFAADLPAEINIERGFHSFIGINNSGKSALLKFFYDLRSIFEQLSDDTEELRITLVGQDSPLRPPTNVTDLEELFCNRNNGDMEVRIKLDKGTFSFTPQDVSEAIIAISREKLRYRVTYLVDGKAIDPQLARSAERPLGNGTILRIPSQLLGDFKHFFKALSILKNTFYIPAFRHISAFDAATSNSDGTNYYDLRIGQRFIQQWNSLQTGNRQKDREKIHNLIGQLSQIFGFSGLQINSSNDSRSLQLLVDGKSLHLYDLGSGLAQFILILGNAAFRESSVVLIDEPELNLHPAFQVKLMRALGIYAQISVMFATHNLGLTREIADHTFTVQQDTNGVRVLPFANDPKLPELLGEINFASFRELGFDKLLMVEGRTDIKTYFEFLRLLNRDSKTLVLSLGGADFINQKAKDELAQLLQICPKVWCVIDSERSQPGEKVEQNRLDFEQNCRNLKIPCKILDLRATENYLPLAAVAKEYGPGRQALGPYDRRRDVQNAWPKGENWKVARHLTRQELETTDLGKFLLTVQ